MVQCYLKNDITNIITGINIIKHTKLQRKKQICDDKKQIV